MSDLSAYTDCLNLADSKMVLAYLKKPGDKKGPKATLTQGPLFDLWSLEP